MFLKLPRVHFHCFTSALSISLRDSRCVLTGPFTPLTRLDASRTSEARIGPLVTVTKVYKKIYCTMLVCEQPFYSTLVHVRSAYSLYPYQHCQWWCANLSDQRQKMAVKGCTIWTYHWPRGVGRYSESRTPRSVSLEPKIERALFE